jgi:hypothetical protein
MICSLKVNQWINYTENQLEETNKDNLDWSEMIWDGICFEAILFNFFV